jgi:hypothetical protein
MRTIGDTAEHSKTIVLSMLRFFEAKCANMALETSPKIIYPKLLSVRGEPVKPDAEPFDKLRANGDIKFWEFP